MPASSAHRPALSMPNGTVRWRRAAGVSGFRLAEGVISARSPAKPSDVTSPAAASSPSACSTWVASRPEPATNSWKNEAPRARSTASTRRQYSEAASRRRGGRPRARKRRAPSGTARSASSRIGPAARVPSAESRPQPTRPVRQSVSSSAGSYSSHAGGRARPIPRRRREARTRRSCSSTPASPSRPPTRCAGLHPLPGEEESHEVGGAHRLDFRAEPVRV